MKRMLILAGVAILVASSASALTQVNDYWTINADPTEMDLYQIYNAIYGTNYDGTSTSNGGGAGAMDAAGLRIDPDQVFGILTQDPPFGGAELRARYAGFTQRFGYYGDGSDPISDPTLSGGDPSSTTPGGTYHWLFDADNVTSSRDYIDTGLFTAQALIARSDAPLGFYDHNPNSGTTWYSQEALNPDGRDHMVAYWAPTWNGQTQEWEYNDDRFIVAFEDLAAGGHWDYNDLVVEVYIPGVDPRDPIPEPASFALLGIGLAAFLARRRFTA